MQKNEIVRFIDEIGEFTFVDTIDPRKTETRNITKKQAYIVERTETPWSNSKTWVHIIRIPDTRMVAKIPYNLVSSAKKHIIRL